MMSINELDNIIPVRLPILNRKINIDHIRVGVYLIFEPYKVVIYFYFNFKLKL